MNITRRHVRTALTVLGFTSLALTSGQAAAQAATYMEQGWTASDRSYFYRTTQGSRLMSYRVFVKLERAGSSERFASQANLGAMGYLFDASDAAQNPDNLPIGFVKDAPYGKSAAIGLTCSACHTRDVSVKNQAGIAQRYRVDGGQAYGDVERFLRELEDALKVTAADGAKLGRLYASIGVTSASDKQAVLAEVNAAIAKLTEERLANLPAGTSVNDPGPGRVDALAHIKNRAANYVYPQNYAQWNNNIDASAPVSYPFLWDAPYQDFNQWPGTASNAGLGPYARNLGEVTGVFAETEVGLSLGVVTAKSSANVNNLIVLENKLLKLKSPLWPSDRAPVDAALADSGGKLFAQHCASCHTVLPREPRTSFVPTISIGQLLVGTDPTQADNNLNDRARAGITDTNLPDALVSPNKILGEVLAQPLLSAAPLVTLLQGSHKQAGVPKRRESLGTTSEGLQEDPSHTYKSRPLNGIWATGPFLHNGSVRTLWDLLVPSEQRPRSFCVGSITLDTTFVGMANDCSAPNSYLFDGTRKGNLPTGHDYGTYQFHDSDRYALVEYMKTL